MTLRVNWAAFDLVAVLWTARAGGLVRDLWWTLLPPEDDGPLLRGMRWHQLRGSHGASLN